MHRVDAEDVDALQRAFGGAFGVFNVQNPLTSSVDAEVRQGRNVAEAAAQAGRGPRRVRRSRGRRAGNGHRLRDSKIEVAKHFRDLGLRLTVLRPMAFMELMTDKGYSASVSV